MINRPMNNSDRIESLLSYHTNKTLVRNVWHGENAMNQETACWLGALGKDISSPSQCPAELMPRWFAELIPSFDDKVSDDRWQEFTDQYVELARQWHVLTPEAWLKIHAKTMLSILNYILIHNKEEKAIKTAISLYKCRKAGYEPSFYEWNFNSSSFFRLKYVYYVLIAEDISDYTATHHAISNIINNVIADTEKTTVWDKVCESCFNAIQKELDLFQSLKN